MERGSAGGDGAASAAGVRGLRLPSSGPVSGTSPRGTAAGGLLPIPESKTDDVEASNSSSPATTAATNSQSSTGHWSNWAPVRAHSSLLSFRSLGGLSTSYFLEKQAVVLDFGCAYTKVGFATESRPRQIFPTPEIGASRQGVGRGGFLSFTLSEEEWIDVLDKLLTRIFFHYLSVSPKDRRVVVCDQVYSPAPFRRALAFVLFKRLVVPSVSFVTDLVLPLYLTGLSSGIVVDCGHTSSRVLATFAGVPVLSAFGEAAAGGRHIQCRLRKLLRKSLPATQASIAAKWIDNSDVVADLAVRACYVTCTVPTTKHGPEIVLKSDLAMPFMADSHNSVDIPAECRWRPTEVLFDTQDGKDLGEEQEEEQEVQEGLEALASLEGVEGVSGQRRNAAECCSSVPEAFCQALERCPIDVRAAVVQNVVVCGGCAALRGLLPRLAMELRDALRARPRMAALAERLRFTPLDFSPVAAVWTGGAVFGALDGAGDLSREDYEKGKPLPDWASGGFM